MSFLDTAKILEELIKSASFLEHESTVQFSKALALLLSFALLYPLESSNYRLHRLVGFCVRVQMDLGGPQADSEGEEHIKSAASVILVYSNFLTSPINDYSKCTQCLPHAMATLGHAGCKNLNFGLRWNLQILVGLVLFTKAECTTARKCYQGALDDFEETLGKDHPPPPPQRRSHHGFSFLQTRGV
jgi:hypothetical protein